MAPLKVLISGGGIAGPAAALWLSRLGHSCTVLERSPGFRAMGQQIDIRGQGIEAAKRLGILDEIRKHVVDEAGLQFVDTDGNVKAFVGRNNSGKGRQSLTSEFEIMRGDLCRILYNASKDSAAYRFGTSVAEVENVEDKVQVRLSDGSEETYDVVIAADGLGSRIRRTMFADAATTRFLGPYACFYSIKRRPGDGNVGTICVVPGRRVMFTRWHSEDQGQAYLLTMTDDDGFRRAMSQDGDAKKAAFAALFRDAGWQAPRLVDAMLAADDFYACPVAQVRTRPWVRGRVVLLGDAGYAPSPLTGLGTSLALAGACVLGGELARAGSDEVPAALRAYEQTLRPYVADCQWLPPGVPALAYPRTALGVRATNAVVGLAARLRIGELLQAVLPAEDAKWRIPEYAAVRRLDGPGYARNR